MERVTFFQTVFVYEPKIPFNRVTGVPVLPAPHARQVALKVATAHNVTLASFLQAK